MWPLTGIYNTVVKRQRINRRRSFEASRRINFIEDPVVTEEKTTDRSTKLANEEFEILNTRLWGESG
eukprot:571574-Amphidinium_carterae.2